MELKGRKALLTGGAQGLGEAICLRLGREGADVAVADINLDQAKDTAEKTAKQYGVKTVALKVNVTDENDVVKMVRDTVGELGGLDLFVNNAGVLKAHDITEFPLPDWKFVVDVNLTGYFLCAREVSKVMVKQKKGSIIQINSKSGKKGSFRSSAYAASKFGGIGFTQSIALDLAPHGVRVNSICPGNLLDSPLWVNSLYKQYAKKWGITEEEVRQKYIDQVPMKRGCTYDDVCNLMVFLAGEKSSYMTGQAINVTGGQEMR